MKRIYIAIFLLALTIVASVFELRFIGREANGVTQQIEAIDGYMRRSEFNTAIKQCRTLEEKWSKTSENIDIMLIHDYVDSIGLSITKMRAGAETKNAVLYFSESASAKKALASIKGSEYPNFENIL